MKRRTRVGRAYVPGLSSSQRLWLLFRRLRRGLRVSQLLWFALLTNPAAFGRLAEVAFRMSPLPTIPSIDSGTPPPGPSIRGLARPSRVITSAAQTEEPGGGAGS